MTLSDERAIIKKVQDGDAEAFGLLVEHYEPKIRRYGRNFLSDKEDIYDIVQNVFMKAYVNIKSFSPDLPFSPWIYRIAHNEFANELRKKSNRPFINIDFDTDIFFPHPVAPETADKESDDNLLKKAMSESLSGLNEKYKEPLVLYFYEELDYKEIADVLHIPVSTVGVRISRGKEKLKEIFEQKYGKQ
ncbi:MAG: RNA polymerase sigma factor [Minisyncoccia bacterium]